VIGQWNQFDGITKDSLDPCARALCEAKVVELDHLKTMVECRILKFYPARMGREVGAPPRSISRMSYSNDIMDWMALGVFRHWFSSALALRRNRFAPDGGFWLYKKLAEGGNTYLSRQELRSFHERFPMSTRGEHVLKEHVDTLKAGIRPLVTELMHNESQLDCERFPVNYLTCVKIEKDKVQKMWEDKEDDMLNWRAQNPNTSLTTEHLLKRTAESLATMQGTPSRGSSLDEGPTVKKSKAMPANGK
jgi:hypothetical protein